MALFGWKSGPPPWARKAGSAPTVQSPSFHPVSSEAATVPVPVAPPTPDIPAELVAYRCFLTQSSLRMQTLPPIVPPDPPEWSNIQGKIENPVEPLKPGIQTTAPIRNKPGLVPITHFQPGLLPFPAKAEAFSLPALSSTASLPFFPAKSALQPPPSPSLLSCEKCAKAVEQLYQEVRCAAGCEVCVECMGSALESNKCPGCERVLSDGELELLEILLLSNLQV